MKKILVVYDSDVFYVTRFLEYFKNKKEFEFDISAFTLQDSLVAYLSQHRVELLLLGQPVALEKTISDNVGAIYQLSEEPFSEPTKEQPVIFKYQRAQKVMDELMAEYIRKRNVGYSDENSKAMDIITVFSPKAGLEEVLCAWSTAFLLTKRKKVLFLLLELIPSHTLPFLEDTNQKLSEFIYFLKEKPNRMEKMLSLLSYHANLSYLAGNAHGFDLLSLSKEDIRSWVSELRLHTEYQAVVFYLDYYNEMSVELMKLSDHVILPTDQSAYRSRILKEWEEQMQRLEYSIEESKYLVITLQKEPVTAAGYGSLQELAGSVTWHTVAQMLNCS